MANWLYMSAETHIVCLISLFAIALNLGMPCYMRMTMELWNILRKGIMT